MNIITLGSFDLLHIGHLKLFKKCSELGSKVIVGLNTDEFITKYKGKPPVMSYEEREAMIKEVKLVDDVLPNDQSDGTAKDLIKKADMIVIGSDWARKNYIKQLGIDWDWLDKNEIGVAYVTYTHKISTSEIKRRLGDKSNNSDTKNWR